MENGWYDIIHANNGIDLNADGAIDKKENTFVYKNYFLSLEQNNYYMDILVEDQSIPLSSISNFKASIEDNRLCYSFDIIQNLDIKKTKFEFYDKDLFVAFMLKKEFVTAENKKVKIIGIDKDFYYINRLEIEWHMVIFCIYLYNGNIN